MVAGKLQGRKCHILNVFLFPCVVFPCLDHAEISLRKQNKIFWIDITFGALFITFARFVQLGLKVCACIVSCVVLRIWSVTPTRSKLGHVGVSETRMDSKNVGSRVVYTYALFHEVLAEINNILLFSGFAVFIGVCIHAEDESMASQLIIR